jgi:outer membrane protein TolC
MYRANADFQAKRNRLLESVIQIRRDQYQKGLISLEDLTEAEVDFVQAGVDYLGTLRNLDLAWVEIALLSGYDPVSALEERGSPVE